MSNLRVEKIYPAKLSVSRRYTVCLMGDVVEKHAVDRVKRIDY
ncbi:uncharacterized protein METZ01_LOCUS139033 [marine metagenome]|uniref:Uncharacterized protein n=1 Tax=marine metagenome TaxID=408172 RepID=A0A381ZAF9_9ZZZZ